MIKILFNKQKQAIEKSSQTLTAYFHLIIQHVPELYLLLSSLVKVFFIDLADYYAIFIFANQR
jgi:hypothetical protein